jgi:hypothetical protein
MKQKFVLPLIWVAITTACGKDKFKTEPQVEVKSISPKMLFDGDVLTIKGDYTDDEGDLDSLLLVYKWYNGNTVVIPSIGDTLRYTFASLNLPPKTREADLIIQFEFGTLNIDNLAKLPGVTRDTTASFGLVLKDRAGHRSNYSESEKIRLKN